MANKQVKPLFNGTPTPDIRSAVNNIDPSYGGIEVIEGSAMRKNYIERMKSLFKDNSNESGVSSGGANYVTVSYDVVDYNVRNPYANGGLKKYKDAYGDSDKYCVVNLDEY